MQNDQKASVHPSPITLHPSDARPSTRLKITSFFMVGHFSHHLATAALVPLLPMVRDSLSLDYTQAGLLLSAFSIPYGLAQLPVAALADRVSCRLVVAMGLVATGIACVFFGLSGSWLHALLAVVLLGSAGATYHAPASAFLSQVFGKGARGRSLGIHVVGGSSGLAVAPLVAVFLASVTGSWRQALIVLGAPAILAGLMIWAVRDGGTEAAGRKAKASEAEKIGLVEIVRLLGFVVVIAAITQLLISGVNSFLPLYLVDKHGVSKEIAGLMVSVVFVGCLTGAPIGGALSDRIGRKPVILISLLGAGPLILLLTVVPFGAGMIAITLAYGMVMIFRSPAIESLIADQIPAGRRATVLGGYYFLSQETAGISTPLIGWTMDQVGVTGGFGALGVLALLGSLVVLLLWKRI